MKDSWGPLKALVVASTINVIGHVVLCTFLGYGIAGAAWATMASQVIFLSMLTCFKKLIELAVMQSVAIFAMLN